MPKTKTVKKSVKNDKRGNPVIGVLEGVLADTYVLAVKTHGYHWNVTGMQFAQLHDFFGKQYEALFEAADELAERIRALGGTVDGSMAAFLKNTCLQEASGAKTSAVAMLKDLLQSHLALRARLVKAEDVADDCDDVGTQDLMVERLREHDKTIWMLRSHIE